MDRNTLGSYWLIWGALVSVLVGRAIADSPSFMGLEHLPGASASYAGGLSGDGSTVVGFESLENGEAYRWTQADGMLGLGYMTGGSHSHASAVSADGSVVVGNGDSDLGMQPFRWTQAGGMVGLGPLGLSSEARAVSADGSVVICNAYGGIDSAYRWTEGTGMVWLGPFSGQGISTDGSIVVGVRTGQAIRWTQAGGIVGLGFVPGWIASRATAISSDGSVIVGAVSDGLYSQGFRWTQASGMVGLGQPPGAYDSVARAVSANGEIIVGYSEFFGGVGRATVWDASHGTRYVDDVLTNDYGLDLAGWTLTWATGISADGRTIAGFGTDPFGSGRSWIAHIPEPLTIVFVGPCIAVVVARRIRRRAPLRSITAECERPSMVRGIMPAGSALRSTGPRAAAGA